MIQRLYKACVRYSIAVQLLKALTEPVLIKISFEAYI